MPRYSPHILLSCLLLLYQTSGYADTGDEPDRDIIKTQLDSAYHLVETDSRSALLFSSDILDRIETCEWKDLEAQAWHNIGRANWYLARYGDCMNAHTNALLIREQLKDSVGIARSFNNLGQVATQMGEYEVAEGFFDESINIRLQQGKTKEWIYSMVSFAELKVEQGHIREAREIFNQASDRADSLGELDVISFVEERFALMEKGELEYENSLVHFDKSLACLSGGMNEHQTSRVLLGKLECEFHLGKGDPQAIPEQVEAILQHAISQNWLPVQELGTNLLADINSSLENYEEEARYLREYFRIHQEIQRETQALAATKVDLENLFSGFLERRQAAEEAEKRAEKAREGANLWRTSFNVVMVLIICLFLVGVSIYTRYINMRIDRNRFKSGQEEAEAKSTRMREFTTTVSHDIKEPIRSVSYFLDLLKRENLLQGKTFMDEMYSEAKKQVDDLDQFLKDLEDYFGLSGGKMEMELVDLEEIMTTIRRRLKSRIAETNAELDVSPMPVVYSQATLLKLILQNLVSNAIKFQPEGNRPEIQVGANLTREKLSISVKDNGIGIPEQFHSGIFHALNRGNSHEYPGTGMGLAIVAKAITILKGSISVYSNPSNGTGTIFLIDLPLIEEPISPANQYIQVESIA